MQRSPDDVHNSDARRRCAPSGSGVQAAVLAAAILCLIDVNLNASRAEESRSMVVSDLDCVAEPSATVELGAAVPGVLADAFHERGDVVLAGALMARLESGVEEVAHAIAVEIAASETAVDLRAATSRFGARTLSRNERLVEDDSVSAQTLDQVRTEADIANLQLQQEREASVLARLEAERARAVLARREIRSPIDGTVLQRYHGVGEYVDAKPVYRVAVLDPLHVEVIVPIEYHGVLERGMKASVTLDVPGFEDSPVEASIRRIDAVADAASATYGVSLELPNPDGDLPSGVRCQIDFHAD